MGSLEEKSEIYESSDSRFDVIKALCKKESQQQTTSPFSPLAPAGPGLPCDQTQIDKDTEQLIFLAVSSLTASVEQHKSILKSCLYDAS